MLLLVLFYVTQHKQNNNTFEKKNTSVTITMNIRQRILMRTLMVSVTIPCILM